MRSRSLGKVTLITAGILLGLLSGCDSIIRLEVDVPGDVDRILVRACGEQGIADEVFVVPPGGQRELNLRVRSRDGALRMRVWGLVGTEGRVAYEWGQNVGLSDQTINVQPFSEVDPTIFAATQIMGRNPREVYASDGPKCTIKRWDGCDWSDITPPSCVGEIVDLQVCPGTSIWFSTKSEAFSGHIQDGHWKWSSKKGSLTEAAAVFCVSETIGFVYEITNKARPYKTTIHYIRENGLGSPFIIQGWVKRSRTLRGQIVAVGTDETGTAAAAWRYAPTELEFILAQSTNQWDPYNIQALPQRAIRGAWGDDYYATEGGAYQQNNPIQTHEQFLTDVWGRSSNDIWFVGFEAAYRSHAGKVLLPGPPGMRDKTPNSAKSVWADGKEVFVAGGGFWHFFPRD